MANRNRVPAPEEDPPRRPPRPARPVRGPRPAGSLGIPARAQHDRRRAGLLLTLCSKNNEEDVAATFRAHPQMPLAPGDFVALRVNWDSKAANLASLAEELDLDRKSVV